MNVGGPSSLWVVKKAGWASCGEQASEHRSSAHQSLFPGSCYVFVPVLTSMVDGLRCGSVNRSKPFLPSVALGQGVLSQQQNPETVMTHERSPRVPIPGQPSTLYMLEDFQAHVG